MTDYASFLLGGFSSPVTASTTNTLLQDADPALYWFTQWCAATVQQHVGSRWDAECAAIGLTSLSGNIVKATLPYDPVPMFQFAQYAFPLLAIYRTESDFSDRTAVWIHRVGTFDLDYILPPLSPAQYERIYPVLSAIEAILYDRINQDFDPNVLSGQKLKDLMATEYIKLLHSRPSRDWLKTNPAQGQGASSPVLFPTLHMRFEIAERKMPDTYEAMAGVDGVTKVSDGTTSVDIAAWSQENT